MTWDSATLRWTSSLRRRSVCRYAPSPRLLSHQLCHILHCTVLFLQQAHAIQSQALENTGKFEGGTGLALADTLFALAMLYNKQMAQFDPESEATEGPSQRQLADTTEYCLSLCLYLRMTLLGCHLLTRETYVELGALFQTQRRCAVMMTVDGLVAIES